MWRLCLLTTATFVCVCAPASAHPHHAHPHTHEPVEAPDTGPVQYPAPSENARWLAGDHHVHSEYSVTWSEKGAPSEDQPPVPRIAGDAIYPIIENARQARAYGLDWMVSTDHGGPNHSRLNLEHAYPDVLAARAAFPDLILFYGMEFDTPGADHSSLIIPHTPDEAERLFEIESQYNKREPFPPDLGWDLEPRMDEALRVMGDLPVPPVMFANHPARSFFQGSYGRVQPSELRRWNDIAPHVMVGMEGAPGHQARAIMPDGSLHPTAPRAGYTEAQTYGGYDPLTATLGGFWDSMLGEGRRWWVTATSDSHRNWRDGGDDFWPGEYAKTFVFADKSYDAVLEGLRAGRVFVATGELITELSMTLEASGGARTRHLGETLTVTQGEDVVITLSFTDPQTENANGDDPSVERVDVIVGEFVEPVGEHRDQNPTTRVLERLPRSQWRQTGDSLSHQIVIENVQTGFYVRLRGTNTDEDEPEADPRGEDPWTDLWFYSNPVFVDVVPASEPH